MIIDKINNIGLYQKLIPEIKEVMDFIKNNDLMMIEDGKYQIDGEKIFAVVQSYKTRDENDVVWESHKKYTDIFYFLKGQEVVGWSPVSRLKLSKELWDEKDIGFYEEISDWTKLIFRANLFGIFFPDDAHKPCCTYINRAEIKKIVFKIGRSTNLKS